MSSVAFAFSRMQNVSISIEKGNKWLVIEDPLILSSDSKMMICYVGSSHSIVVPRYIEVLGWRCFSGARALFIWFEDCSELNHMRFRVVQ
jgi:hypothetical protein